MKKPFYLSITTAAAILISLFAEVNAQPCIPASTRPVFGTVTGSTGTFNFNNVPTGNVIQITCPAANIVYNINACGTNAGNNVPSGTNDGFVTILNANGPAATSLGTLDDGCTNMAAPGYGPPVGNWTSPAAGTYFIYLTEYDANGNCVANGANTAYRFVITLTAPPSNDLALDSAALPSLYTSVALQQLTPFAVGARVRNVGGTNATNVSVNVRIRNVTTNTVVNTQTLTGPASLAAGASALVSGTAYNAPAAPAVYEFRYISSMSQVDANTTNDTAFRYVAIDESLLAIDDAILFGQLDNVLGLNSQGIAGQRFVFNTATAVDTIFAYFGTQPANVGQQVRAVIYNTNNGVPTTLLTASPNYTFAITDTPGRLVPFVFNPNANIPAGTYLIGIEQFGTVNMGIGFTNQNYIAGNSLFSVSPYTTWNPLELASFAGSFIIWVNTKLNCTLLASGSGNNPTCGQSNGQVTTNVTGASVSPTFIWSNGATSANLSNVAPGTYTVTVSAGGCTDTAVVVLQNSGTVPGASIASTNASCGQTNGTATVTATGGSGSYTYLWSNGGTTNQISNLSAGQYTVTVTSAPCTATASVFVSSTGGPTTSTNGSNVSCNGGSNGSASVTASGGTAPYTYSWSNGGTSANLNNISAGTYTVTVADASACLSTASFTVSQPAAITTSINNTDISCHNGSNGSATVIAGGGTGSLSYSWSNGGTGSSVSNLAAGTATVTVTDANQCTATASVTLANPAALTLTVAPTAVSCNGGANGLAAATAGGGTGSLTYAWSNNGTTASVNNLSAGSYTVTVTDAKGCTITASTTITQPAALVATAECEPTIIDQNNGSASVTASGGTGTYTYAWSSGSTSATATNLAAATYTVTVTDANQCTTTAECEVQFTIGIEETLAGISKLTVYPNPSNGVFSVDLALLSNMDVEITIVDVRGALISREIMNETSAVRKAYNLTTVAKGVYTLSIKTAQGQISKRLIIE